MPTETPRRVYFVDGPAAGTSLLTTRTGPRLSFQDAEYRRVTNLRGTHFYRRVRTV